VAAVATVIATVAVITVTCGILGVTYLVYNVCIIKRVWVFISLVTSSSLQCFDAVGWAAGRASGL